MHANGGYWVSEVRMSVERIKKEGIEFAHQANPEPPNIGDYLCAPYHYFKFQLSEKSPLKGRCLVIGGGAIRNAKELFSDSGYAVRIVWGTGVSDSHAQKPPKRHRVGFRWIRRMLSSTLALSRFLPTNPTPSSEKIIASTRDPIAAGTDMLVPCVSCMHSICDTTRGHGVAVILNNNPKVSGDINFIKAKINKAYPSIVFETNSLKEDKLYNIFETTDRILTNSYHITYWSLLSGGQVQVLGYSTKLESVLSLCGIPPNFVRRYSRGQGDELFEAVKSALEAPNWLSLPDAVGTRESFRQRNRDFAARVMAEVPDLKIMELQSADTGHKHE